MKLENDKLYYFLLGVSIVMIIIGLIWLPKTVSFYYGIRNNTIDIANAEQYASLEGKYVSFEGTKAIGPYASEIRDSGKFRWKYYYYLVPVNDGSDIYISVCVNEERQKEISRLESNHLKVFGQLASLESKKSVKLQEYWEKQKLSGEYLTYCIEYQTTKQINSDLICGGLLIVVGAVLLIVLIKDRFF